MHLKPKIIWIDAVGCNGCSHSFFNLPYLSTLLEKIELLYHPLIDSDEFKIQDSDILIIEGALRDDFVKFGDNLLNIIEKLFIKTQKVIALGSCASFGGMFGEGLIFNKENYGKFYTCKNKIINLPGCPIHPEWLGYVLDMIINNKNIILDEENRPKELYSYVSHSGCIRNEYFDWKVDTEDFGRKEGCLFYNQGCQGPFTHSSCNRILWNDVNSKPRAGTPCFGCTERNFPKENLFLTDTMMGIPAKIPLGVTKRAYLTLAGIAKSLKNERLEKRLFEYEKTNHKN
jgi:hydrogenase small subunit